MSTFGWEFITPRSNSPRSNSPRLKNGKEKEMKFTDSTHQVLSSAVAPLFLTISPLYPPPLSKSLFWFCFVLSLFLLVIQSSVVPVLLFSIHSMGLFLVEWIAMSISPLIHRTSEQIRLSFPLLASASRSSSTTHLVDPVELKDWRWSDWKCRKEMIRQESRLGRMEWGVKEQTNWWRVKVWR